MDAVSVSTDFNSSENHTISCPLMEESVSGCTLSIHCELMQMFMSVTVRNDDGPCCSFKATQYLGASCRKHLFSARPLPAHAEEELWRAALIWAASVFCPIFDI